MKRSKKNSKKIITGEMVRNLSIAELVKLQQEGWKHDTPLKTWGTESKDDGKTETYIAGTVPTVPGREKQSATDPKLEALLNDPELKKIADQIGTTPRSLLLMRELLLDRHGHHEVDDDED